MFHVKEHLNIYLDCVVNVKYKLAKNVLRSVQTNYKLQIQNTNTKNKIKTRVDEI